MTQLHTITNYGTTTITQNDALLVIDMQYDFYSRRSSAGSRGRHNSKTHITPYGTILYKRCHRCVHTGLAS